MTFKICGYHLANSNSGHETINNYHRLLDTIIPTWLEIKDDGNIEEKHTEKDYNFLKGLSGDISIIPLIQNYRLKSEISNHLLENEDARNIFINNLINFMKNSWFSGINIDLEGVNISNREKFNLLIAEIAAVFREYGYHLGLSIPAKSENNKDSTWSGAYNYGELGELADEVMIMAYDYHWSGGPAGPVAPLFWVQDVIDYAIIEIPPEKIYLGIALYGYDWEINSDKSAEGLSYLQIKNLLDRYHARIEWDQESWSPYFSYRKDSKQHEVWFENQESIKKKIEVSREFQLAGVAFWRLGLEDVRIWKLLDNGMKSLSNEYGNNGGR